MFDIRESVHFVFMFYCWNYISVIFNGALFHWCSVYILIPLKVITNVAVFYTKWNRLQKVWQRFMAKNGFGPKGVKVSLIYMNYVNKIRKSSNCKIQLSLLSARTCTSQSGSIDAMTQINSTTSRPGCSPLFSSTGADMASVERSSLR